MLNVKVGDKVLVVKRYGAMPVESVVALVAKKTFKIVGEDVLFRIETRWKGRHDCYYNKGSAAVYGDDNETRTRLLKEHESHVASVGAKKADVEARRAGAKARNIAEVKEIMGLGIIEGFLATKSVMPNGDRMYVGKITVKAEYLERKGGWEWVAVRLRNERRYDFDVHEEVDMVGMSVTYTNGGTGSFPSMSMTHHKSDEEAVVEALRRVYVNW